MGKRRRGGGGSEGWYGVGRGRWRGGKGGGGPRGYRGMRVKVRGFEGSRWC